MLERVKENIKVFVHEPAHPVEAMYCRRAKKGNNQNTHWWEGPFFWKRQLDTAKKENKNCLFVFECPPDLLLQLLFWQRPEKPQDGDTPCDLYGSNFPTKALIRNANYHLYFHVGNSLFCLWHNETIKRKLSFNKYACLFSWAFKWKQ